MPFKKLLSSMYCNIRAASATSVLHILGTYIEFYFLRDARRIRPAETSGGLLRQRPRTFCSKKAVAELSVTALILLYKQSNLFIFRFCFFWNTELFRLRIIQLQASVLSRDPYCCHRLFQVTWQPSCRCL